jgi:uncharacterized membrane protein
MPDAKNIVREKRIHLAFVISLFLKGLFALGEIVGGIVAFFCQQRILAQNG